VCMSTQMEIDMRAIGSRMSKRAMVSISLIMVVNIRASGYQVFQKAKGHLSTQIQTPKT
jgi:hypothetical protein